MKKSMICLLVATMLLSACSLKDSQETNNSTKNDKVNEVAIEDDDKKDTTENTEDVANENQTASNSNNASEEINKPSDNISEDNISEKVKDYILNGQEDKSEAEKLKWSNAFLNQVDIEALYNQYISEGGNAEDIKKIAEYITTNAPIQDDWEELFKKELFDVYGQEVVKLEHLEGDLYQAYVNIDGSEVPYVTVSARTGYFHG